MSINVNKSACVRIGQNYSHVCKSICTLDGHEIPWSDSMRYLGVYITSAKVFTCCLSNTERSFYRAFNSVFGKVANAATEPVAVELLKSKCLPMLYYGLEACPISKTHYKSLNYVLNSSFRKNFRTKLQDVVKECMIMFDCSTAEEAIYKRKCKFLNNYVNSDNLLCCVCQVFANEEISGMKMQTYNIIWLSYLSVFFIFLYIFLYISTDVGE